MGQGSVNVPAAILLAPDQTAATKVIWMARCLHPHARPAELEAHTGLSRPTILRGLERVAGHARPPGGPKVQVPVTLLSERTVGSQAKVLYGLLQVTPEFRGQSGRFTYAGLVAQTRLSRNTLKAGVAELAGAGWLRVQQKTQFSPIRFTLGSPAWRRSLAEAAAAGRRLQRDSARGEAIMQEYLSLLIDSDEFTDNARPGFLINPLTGERLELDRFYPQRNVAFEFHGTQHFHATERFSQATVDAQHVRDLIKAGVCVYRGIHLVIINAADLSVPGITAKISGCMPLRNLAGHEPLIDLLDEASIKYIANTPGARQVTVHQALLLHPEAAPNR